MTDQALSSRQQIPVATRRAKVNPWHGYMVGVLKLLLPATAIALVLLVAIWPIISKQNERFRIDLEASGGGDVENITMENPRYTGIDSSNQPFAVTATAMNQESTDAADVELEAPKADILLSDGTWAAITALTGSYNRETKLLTLETDVNLFHDGGYEFRTSSATLDLVGGNAHGAEPVEGQGPFGHLSGQGFQIYDRGSRIVLTGQSKVTIYNQDGS